jgi:excisionase family DNA binding protein
MNEKRERAMIAKEVAVELGVSVHTVHALLRAGELVGFKIKRQWRVRPEAVVAFETRGRRP